MRKKKEIEISQPTVLNKVQDAKDRAVEELIKHGYDARLESGVVICKRINENTFAEITEILEGIGYNYSYGVTNIERMGYE